MRRLFALLAGLALGFPSLVDAGAWPREQGSTFVAAGISLRWPQDLSHWTSAAPTQEYRTFYLEYGLTDRVTLGLDLGRSVSGDDKSIVFAQIPILQKDRGPKLALQLGVGMIGEDTILRPGLAVGWGLKQGWLSADAVAEVSTADGGTDLKLDVTWGRKLARDRKLILQMQLGAPQDDPAFARFAPSLVVPLRGKLKSEIGATWGVAGDTSMGLRFGLWAEF